MKRYINVVWLIPQGLYGNVGVYYDYSDGQDTEYRNNSRVYRIPNDGILKTKFTSGNIIKNIEVYILTKEGVEIPVQKYNGDKDSLKKGTPYFFGGTLENTGGTLITEDEICVKHRNVNLTIGKGKEYEFFNHPYISVANEPQDCTQK